jgi:hypothetical protein
MMIATGEQGRPGRRAKRGGVKSRVAQPCFGETSKFGVGIWPPNVLHCPKPQSSIRMNKTLGAPSGALMTGILSGTESL